MPPVSPHVANPTTIVAVSSIRGPLLPMGGPHANTSTTALLGTETFGHVRSEDAWVNGNVNRVSEFLQSGANVVLAFILHHATAANGLTASARVWLSGKAGQGVPSSNPGQLPKANRWARHAFDLTITAGNIPVAITPEYPDDLFPSPLLLATPAPLAAAHCWASSLLVASDSTLTGVKNIGGNGSIAMVVFDKDISDKIIVATRLTGAGATGITVLQGTL